MVFGSFLTILVVQHENGGTELRRELQLEVHRVAVRGAVVHRAGVVVVRRRGRIVSATSRAATVARLVALFRVFDSKVETISGADRTMSSKACVNVTYFVATSAAR